MDPRREFAPGEKVGPFTLKETKGRGSMGEVWRAEGADGQVVALKLPRRPSFVRHLRREGVLLSKLDHPRVARLVAADLDGDVPWLATEFVAGDPLRALCRGTMSSKQVTLLADQILDGLAAIHKAGIVHQDLKPENVLVDANGSAKIVDLGLGRATNAVMAELYLSASLASRDLPLAGTLAYMAPEQRKGRPADSRADLFAFGVLLHELISGKLPEPGVRLSKVRKDLTPRWDVVIAKLLHPEPDQRPASAAEARQLVSFTLQEKSTLPVATGGLEPRDLKSFDEEAFAYESPWTPGMVVGDCELEAPLGRGGFGEVWRAKRRRPDAQEGDAPEVVAVKLALRDEAREALTVEAAAARRVSHAGIPKVLDDRTKDDPPHVVFELVSGRSLRARIHDEGHIPLDEGLETFERMLDVVHACHEAGVVHRDLKPEHFLVDELPDKTRRVSLIDFGLASLVAKRHDLEGSVGSHADARGTFDYMAPEQRDGTGTGPEVDRFAMGVCLFEIVADDLPRGPQRLSTLRRGVPHEIDELVLELMAKDPWKRPRLDTARDVVRGARGSLVTRSGQVVAAKSPFPWPELAIGLSVLAAAVALLATLLRSP